MKLGFQRDDRDSSAEQSLDGSFRKCFQQNSVDSSPGHSLNGSFRHSQSGISTHRPSSISASTKSHSNSKRVFKVLKEYTRKLVDLDLFTGSLEDWFVENLKDTTNGAQPFRSPFTIDELRTFDFALEGVLFQQLFRMPFSPYASDDVKENEYLALEDFLHTMADGLWRTFWHRKVPLPYFVSCPRYPGSKFYTVEKAISRGKLGGLCGAALISKARGNRQIHWNEVVELALFRPDITMGNEFGFSSATICEALFYGVHLLLSRTLSKSHAVTSDSVFLLVLDSKFGGVIKLSGDLGKLEPNLSNPYESMVVWLKCHAEVSVSQVDCIWNKLGNANWGDLGTLQLLLATYYSFVQRNGPPRKSIVSLASNHSLRLQKRMMECRFFENENESENALVPFQQAGHRHGEISELDHNINSSPRKQATHLQLKQADILLLEDQQQGQKSFQIQESLGGGIPCSYTAVDLEYPNELLSLYVGAHPSRLEPSWEDMSLWHSVQRQTKILNIFKHQDISIKHLPEMVASGRILHPGPCKKQTPGGRCDHPWCGTPILVTYPVGDPLSSIVTRDGSFSSEEALRCFRDVLAALNNAKMAGVQHGDICPENVIRVVNKSRIAGSFLYILISWGRAVLEDKDSPALNLQFSSAHALQHGKLCPSSDAESLIYLLHFVCGGTTKELDSIESALQWRQRCWTKRVVQQQLGDVSPLLKAFTDYVDGLCGTPYPVDYDIWLKRLDRAVDGSADKGKQLNQVLSLKEDVAECSGTSMDGNS
ncbi:Serine/threonine-protein kinase [Actinidia chinensis var. chinensis]|uniref:Serine/threonine-protein kinase n=1 Tax=Actinidia chinensis var. chinensis TaxID=1590841 RepID=A0A2R6PAP3_ACTCC|nr:Serine/threonine-protein kinase [Actinidia chinensis var. chinensis]